MTATLLLPVVASLSGGLLAVLVTVAVCLALLPAALTLANLRVFRRSPPAAASPPTVSVLVPARNEEAAIERLCRDVRSVAIAAGSEEVLLDQAIAAMESRNTIVKTTRAGSPHLVASL